jgi:hypothetical protein
VLAVVAAAAVVVAVVALAQRGGSSPAGPTPEKAKPSQRYGDDADLMRRLERKKLVEQGSKR